MKVRNAAIRAVRSLIQGTIAAGGAFLLALADRGELVGLADDAAVFLFAEALAAGYAVLSFLQNLLEDNTELQIPKG
jgi:hypothetical protein